MITEIHKIALMLARLTHREFRKAWLCAKFWARLRIKKFVPIAAKIGVGKGR